ncbi:AP-4 complex accessory subunit RUSC1 isoform X2 [Neoarius graeffei]|uniref:AP-4 complex accessory subunit RUSC1 isoform X2 n=1 Tax=Neoarius graeffei TaxID=443677 RepID=UPI00298CCA7A|nr:AP-4 complex accessory subunit RUSC1 isoform X2 [Neoarius graeffei]
MGDDGKPPLIGGGLSPLCLQEKRALISAVSVAVEDILAQFSSSRTLVQKALSGDSSVNPTLGRLVLQCLCPALHGLLCDGLKPHQSDLITGRRPNSPWGLVQASTKPGPNTQALYSLQAKVAALPQLKQSRHRFNAFLFGLLNIKRLDYWLSHLQTCHDVLETYYWPTSFMRLSGTFCQPLFEELLLMLQPLSLLTFNLDLLFQHHHFDPLSPALSPPRRSPQSSSPDQPQTNGQYLKNVFKQSFTDPKAASHNSSPTSTSSSGPTYCRPIGGTGKGETSPQLQWLQEKEIIAPPSIWSGSSFSQQAGQALQQGWGAMIRWSERLGQNWNGLASTGLSEEAKAHTVPDLNTPSSSDCPKSPGQELLTAEGETVSWGLGRLFGVSKSPNNPPTKRRPSHWLNPGITVLSRISSTGQAFLPEKIEPGKKEARESSKNDKCKETGDQPKPQRAVRTLCDHMGTGAELSFKKGEELLLLGGVDQDWIRCRQGDKEGLVPIGYASLIM